MKIKNETIYNLFAPQAGAGTAPVNKILTTEMGGCDQYAFRSAYKKMKPIFDTIIETRDSLITKYGKQNDEGVYAIAGTSENWGKFTEEFNEVLNKEEDVDIDTMSMEALQKVQVTNSELDAILFLFGLED